MSVGANIRKRRFELKMSQQELADAMGYKTRSTIAKIESGEIKPSIYKVLPIEKAAEAHAILERGENIGKVVLIL